MNVAINMAIEALENMERHSCFTCMNNIDGGRETQNVISCGQYERKKE